MLEIWCYDCNDIRELGMDDDGGTCPKCNSEAIEWLEPEEELSAEDVYEWMYGNDYDKFVK